MVYVIDMNGNPLMPTNRHGKVRRMLKSKTATVVSRSPFTIRLNYEPKTHEVQNVALGIDINKEICGISAQVIKENTTEEIFAAEVVPRQDVGIIVKQTRELRLARRRRNNRRKSHIIYKGKKTRKNQKFSISNLTFNKELRNHIIRISKFIPVNQVMIENAELDICNYTEDVDYLRTRTLMRDGHRCQCCYGKSKEKILVTKKIVDKYITLCKKCKTKLDVLREKYIEDKSNKKNSNKYFKLINKIKSNNEKYTKFKDNFNKMKDIENRKVYSKTTGSLIPSFKEFTCMTIESDLIENSLIHNSIDFGINRISGIQVRKSRRQYNLQNKPITNARVIVNPYYDTIKTRDDYFYYRFRKYRSRSLHKIKPMKGGIRPVRSPKIINGFSSYDEVRYLGDKYPEYYGKTFFITKKRKTGYFAIGKADGTTIINSVKSNLLQLITKRKTYSVEHR